MDAIPLQPHPATPCAAVTSLTGAVLRDRDLHLTYELRGDLEALAIPTASGSGFADELWRHTCFEAFVAPDPGTSYREYNFSPGGQWASYGFSDYRKRSEPDPRPPAPKTTWQRGAGVLTLIAVIALPADTGAIRLGLSAVIETRGGKLSYWALRHPGSRPDFHHADGFTLRVAP